MVTRTFKFFVYHFVHLGARVNQTGGDDGKAPAFFNIACCAKETLWSLKCMSVNATSQDLP